MHVFLVLLNISRHIDRDGSGEPGSIMQYQYSNKLHALIIAVYSGI